MSQAFDFSGEKVEGEQVAFNMGLAYLQRIHQLIVDANMCSRSGMMFEWKSTLDAVYRELHPKMNVAELEDFEKGKPLMNQKLVAYFNVASRDPSGTTPSFYRRQSELYAVLGDYELKLRKVMQSHGYLMPSKEDPRFAIKERGMY